MICHTLTDEQEINIRLEYVNCPEFSYDDSAGYHDFAISNIPGVIEAEYKGGNPNYLTTLTFDTNQNRCWFVLRYS